MFSSILFSPPPSVLMLIQKQEGTHVHKGMVKTYKAYVNTKSILVTKANLKNIKLL